MNALIVDDSKLTIQMIRQLLQQMGFDTMQARNGTEGYEAYLFNACDLIVTDLLMPECDGVELIRRIRAIDRSVPIVVLTSVAEDDLVEQAREAGANAYLLKPLNEALFKQRVNALVQPLRERELV